MESINFVMVFLEGLISVISPCILGILPLYFSYISNSAKIVDKDGNVSYKQSKIFLITLCFIFGICFSFFLLGLSVSFLENFLLKYRTWISIISGVIIIIFGLFQLNIFKFSFLQKEKRISVPMKLNGINYFSAFLLGFTFSFAWTPCVGPILSSVLLLMASASKLIGILYLVLYSLGFIIPFLILGIFTTSALNLLKKNQNFIHQILKWSGVILIIVGFGLIITNTITIIRENQVIAENVFERKYVDQFQIEHALDDYRNQIIVLSFLDRYCAGCQEEIPILKDLNKEYDKEDVLVLGVIQMNAGDTYDSMMNYLKEKEYSFPVLIDTKNELSTYYKINTYPSIYLFQKGEFKKSFLGAVSKEVIKEEIWSLSQNNQCELRGC